ncbi:regulatory protein RecX [Microbacterium memoriense]|uniref:Regulatory protein RecX n=1 Tax=Microbacterium memoriense TaxID=2978350 RepID=A0ABT2PB95_9MICO|nr:regulatory protein RecX [Microbacterium memoriense]MCT9001875.1 recombination regulator RecX [Microbacterium memoriense]
MSVNADDHLAPVIPLFGGPAPAAPAEHGVAGGDGTPARRPVSADRVPARAPESADRVPARGPVSTSSPGIGDGSWHTTWTEPDPRFEQSVRPDESDARDLAEKRLLKKLRVRSLSEREARSFLREQDVAPDAVEHVIDAFVRHGYLDDARLAEQLIHAGTTRKGQGRQAISLALGQRGIPRDVADAALAEVADDDAERALEFARQKARAMRGLDREVAVRRLVGQLSRRGYGGLALSTARQALDELERPAARGVRFE